VNTKVARILFGAALALYLLWFAALVTLGIVSGARPGDAKPHPATPPVTSLAVSDQP
jgi:hypothetical protein